MDLGWTRISLRSDPEFFACELHERRVTWTNAAAEIGWGHRRLPHSLTASYTLSCLIPAHTEVLFIIHEHSEKSQYWRSRCQINSFLFPRQSLDYDQSQSNRVSCASLVSQLLSTLWHNIWSFIKSRWIKNMKFLAITTNYCWLAIKQYQVGTSCHV